jgi:hypothetical protein
MYNSRSYYEIQAGMTMEKIVEQRRVLNYINDVRIKIDVIARIKQLESELDFYVRHLKNM